MWTSRRARLIAPWMGLVGLLALGVGCGGEDTCFTEYNCGPGRRCELGPNFTEGVCVACDPAEIPYDGLDNDCRTNTPDDDLDGDGDNSSRSRVRPGTDCDDNDPEVSGNVAESKRGTDESLCRDGKDNDCDQVVDELDCSDLTRPAVGFLTPTNGQGLSGRFVVQVSASDRPNETGVREVRLEVVGRAVLGTRMSPPYDFEIDTTQIPDGVIVLRATAVDGALRESSAEISVYVDNYSGPRIMLTLPSVGERRGGVVPIVAQAVDAVGVFDFAVEEQGTTLNRVQGGLLDLDLDTRMLRWPDGPRTLTLVARDNNGAETRLALPLEIDNTPPTLTLTPAAGGMPLTGLVEFVATAAGDDEIAWVDVAGRRTMGPATGRLEARVPFNTLALPNGPWVVTATAADTTPVSRTAVGNTVTIQASYTVFNPENANPVLGFVSPVTGQTIIGPARIEVRIDYPIGMQAISLSLNGRQLRYVDFGMNPLPSYVFSFVEDFDDEPASSTLELEVMGRQGRIVTESVGFNVVRPLRFGSPRVASERSVGAAERPIDVADVDSDGLLDLVTNYPLSIHFGVGGGRFQGPTPVNTPDGRNPMVCRSIAVRDLDGDRLPDLICDNGSEIVLAFQVDARGPFFRYASVPTLARSFVALDVDLDGDVDIVATGGAPVTPSVFINTRGSFAAPAALAAGAGAISMAAADLDGDGNEDLVVTRVDGRDAILTTFLARPSGLLLTNNLVLQATMVGLPAVGNFDGDSIRDLAFVACDRLDGRVMLAHGAAPGTFVVSPTPLDVGVVGCSHAVAADVNADGTVEVLVRRYGEVLAFDPSARRQVARMTWAESINGLQYSSWPYWTPLPVDLDADGNTDFVDLSNLSYAIIRGRPGVFPGLFSELAEDVSAPEPALGMPVRVGPSARPAYIRVASAGVAGSIDLVALDRGQLRVIQSVPTMQPASCLDVATLPNGELEVAACVSQTIVVARLSEARAELTQTVSLPSRLDYAALGDVDGDGLNDLFACHGRTERSQDGVLIRRTLGGLGATMTPLPSIRRCFGLLVEDLDTDGLMEAIVMSDGSQPWQLFDIPAAGPVPMPRTAGSFSPVARYRVGRSGATVIASPDGGVSIMDYDPATVLRTTVTSGFAGGYSLLVDANQDGALDLIGGTSRVVGTGVCENYRGQLFCSTNRHATLGEPIMMDDFDGDGIADLMVSASGQMRVHFGR